ncbi:MAG: YjbQ family protein [Armatimonadetes bacterium]|nr:YjbQ family protein [Armatimonadota bacterium]
MTSHTKYLTFNTPQRRALVNITPECESALAESGIREGMMLVSAMHITAAVWVNDNEPGILQDAMDMLEELAPEGPDYRHHRTGEDNGHAHLKNLLTHHQVILPITNGKLDLGPWQTVFYVEFDGARSKRLIIKTIGE